MSRTTDELNAMVTKVTAEGFDPYGDETTGDERDLWNLIDDQDEGCVRAAAEFLLRSASSMEVASLESVFRNGAYRGEHRTFGDFVREEKLTLTEGRGKAAAEVFNELADYVDWEEYGKAPEWSDYTEVRLYPEDDPRTMVYVFRDL